MANDGDNIVTIVAIVPPTLVESRHLTEYFIFASGLNQVVVGARALQGAEDGPSIEAIALLVALDLLVKQEPLLLILQPLLSLRQVRLWAGLADFVFDV